MPQLDHLVFATADLGGAVDRLTAALGIAPVAGGRHDGRGTRNYLLGLGGGSYLEVIGPDLDQSEPAEPRPFGVDNLTEDRLVGWAARTDEIEAVCERARASGYDPGRVLPMQRTTPTGDVLRWTLTYSAPRGQVGTLPFLIDWGTTTHPAITSPQGATLESFEIVAPDDATTRAVLDAIGLDQRVVHGPVPVLRATIVGPAGAVTLQ